MHRLRMAVSLVNSIRASSATKTGLRMGEDLAGAETLDLEVVIGRVLYNVVENAHESVLVIAAIMAEAGV